MSYPQTAGAGYTMPQKCKGKGKGKKSRRVKLVTPLFPGVPGKMGKGKADGNMPSPQTVFNFAQEIGQQAGALYAGAPNAPKQEEAKAEEAKAEEAKVEEEKKDE